MKLFNTIIVYDIYTVAESEEEARAAALVAIRDAEQPEPPSEQTAIEAREARNVRTSWQSKRPIVGSDVSDADFETLKGKTSEEVRQMIYTKQ